MEYSVIIAPAIVQGGGKSCTKVWGLDTYKFIYFRLSETFIWNNKHLVLNPPINTVSSPKELTTEFTTNSLFASSGVKQIAYKLLHG